MKEELSIDNLDAEIKTNRELYEQLNKITEIEAVNPYDSQENEISNVVQEQKFFSEYITRLKRIYNDNDLFRYALWSIVLMLFSTTILCPFAYFEICLAQDSTHFKSLALPAPIPRVFVGVFTEMKIISASDIHL